MIVFMTPSTAQKALAVNMKERRLALNLTQSGLSERSGVRLGTLRRFEQSGAISLENLFKLMMIVGGLKKMVAASAPDPVSFASIEDVISGKIPPNRKRGSRS